MTQTEINTVTMAIGILTAGAGIVQYSLTKHSEFRKRFWDEQLNIYRRTCVAASSLATVTVLADVEKERMDFWRLYWGELSILENKEVKAAMEAFGAQLRKVQEGKAAPQSLEELSYRLARACRESLEKTWDPVGIDDLSTPQPH